MKKLFSLLMVLAASAAFAQTRTMTTTTTTTTTTHHVRMNSRTRVHNDAARLAALLSDAQRNVNFESATWRTVANEANMLANRVYGETAGNKTARAAARDLRMQVREFRNAAMKGDAGEARAHAAQAQPYAYRIIDWAS